MRCNERSGSCFVCFICFWWTVRSHRKIDAWFFAMCKFSGFQNLSDPLSRHRLHCQTVNITQTRLIMRYVFAFLNPRFRWLTRRSYRAKLWGVRRRHPTLFIRRAFPRAIRTFRTFREQTGFLRTKEISLNQICREDLILWTFSRMFLLFWLFSDFVNAFMISCEMTLFY